MESVIRPDLSTVKPAKKQSLSGAATEIYEKCLSVSGNESDHCDVDDVVEPITGVFYIDNVLSSAECEKLCLAVNNSQSLSFWSEGDQLKEEFRMFRNANTIEVQSTELVDVVWNRVSRLLNFLELHVEDSVDDMNYERELPGHWVPCGLNADILFAKYPSFGSFAPHTDGRTIADFNRRSFYSVIIFLNDIPLLSGGGTRFYDDSAVKNLMETTSAQGVKCWTADPSLVRAEVEAVRGRMLIFHQSLVHEGVPSDQPHQKFIIRSDVMMQRQNPLCDSAADREAFALFRQAEDLSESGKVQESVALFRRAFKLSPAMAAMMGQA